ncbi:hypothetical protein Taro_012898 [Colocasia esculenta]|uniref:F-box protein n=1 Tax=Colocasia esculenta TaxID=4460 RepID=A0A843UE40_COLES|nr:hypothetical protein [Colocasia esculenta]
MATLQAQHLLLSPCSPLQAPHGGRFRAGLRNPIKVPMPRGLSVRKKMVAAEDQMIRTEGMASVSRDQGAASTSAGVHDEDLLVVTSELYAVMEAAADRAGMHDAVGAQRDNWNTLLLGSVNSITLAASLAAGLSGISAGMPAASPHQVAFKASSVLLYSAATAILLVVNKIQPSQLAEEQRNAARLFRQLEKEIQTTLALGRPAPADVEDAMERVLALDRAYPLPLLGGLMLDKFPKAVEPTVWWPRFRQRRRQQRRRSTGGSARNNGWSEGLERVMAGVLRVLKKNDTAEYVREAKLALQLNTVLAAAGPLLTGLAAIGASLVDVGGANPGGSWPLLLGVVTGSLAVVINTLEHGGQVGMVFEMYRNCAGFYRRLEEEIELNLEEEDVESREDGELLELKVALQLGRSLPELRGLCSHSRSRDEDDIREFAGKLF